MLPPPRSRRGRRPTSAPAHARRRGRAPSRNSSTIQASAAPCSTGLARMKRKPARRPWSARPRPRGRGRRPTDASRDRHGRSGEADRARGEHELGPSRPATRRRSSARGAPRRCQTWSSPRTSPGRTARSRSAATPGPSSGRCSAASSQGCPRPGVVFAASAVCFAGSAVTDLQASAGRSPTPTARPPRTSTPALRAGFRFILADPVLRRITLA